MTTLDPPGMHPSCTNSSALQARKGQSFGPTEKLDGHPTQMWRRTDSEERSESQAVSLNLMCSHVRDDQAATQSQILDLPQLGKLAVVTDSVHRH